MSKYIKGDKVVMEITDRFKNAYGHEYYSILDSVYSTEFIDEKSEPLRNYTEPLEAKIRRQAAEITRHFAENKRLKAENGNVIWEIEQAFDRGCNAAWELVRKIVKMKLFDYKEIFNSQTLRTAINMTYPEAAAKVSQWEKAKEEIKVGDVVRLQEGSDNDLCILCKTSDEKYYNAVDKYGALYPLLRKEHFSKTGRHIDIDGFLKQISGEQE